MRVFVLFGVLAISACGVPGARKCKTNGDCEKQLCLDGYCYYPDDGGSAGAGGGSGGGSSGTGGGDVGGGVGGGVAELTSLSFTSPKDGARTKETTVALKVEGKPVNATGKAVTYAASLVDGGDAKSGSFTADAGNVYEATLNGLTEGEWKIEASSGTLKSWVKFVVDRTPPSVKLAMEPAPARMNDGGLNEIDPANGYAQAFRRDEVGELRVLTSESVQIATSQFSGVPTSALSERNPCSGACDAGACKCFNVDMAQVTIPSPGFRGELTVGLKNVADDLGNVAPEVTTTFKVTRWKWKKFVIASPAALFSPAIDTSGKLFVGATVAPTTGVVMGLEANGSQNFRVDSYGAMTAPAVVGRNVYVATKDSSDGRIRTIDFATGSSSKFGCAAGDRTYDSAMAVVGLDEADDRVVAASSGSKWLVTARPSGSSVNCPEKMLSLPGPYSIVATDVAAYLGLASDSAITRMPWTGSAWDTAQSNTVTPLRTMGFALFGTTLAGAGGLSMGGLYAFDEPSFAAGTAATFIRNNGVAHASGPAVTGTGTSPIFVYGHGPNLIRVAYTIGAPSMFSNDSVVKAPTDKDITTSPVIGGGTLVYVVDAVGTVTSYSSDLSDMKWQLSAGTDGINGNKVDAPLNIDVARKPNGMKDCSKPGTLYASSTGDGSLYAFVVDSKGIDATAPWPRFQHDPRNSGNPAVPLSDFSCQ